MKHPSEIQLALLSGGDLNLWERWRIGRHVSHCANCRKTFESFQAAATDLRDFAAELPEDVNWRRLAGEMTGNIRVGLAAGEAIARFDKPAARHRPRLAWNATTLLACASALFLVAFWMDMPRPQAEHLVQALKSAVSHGGAVQRAGFGQEDVVLEASSSGIELKENGRTMSFTHPHSDEDSATVSVNMQGSAGVRFVDADTGQVTTTKVYYAEQ